MTVLIIFIINLDKLSEITGVSCGRVGRGPSIARVSWDGRKLVMTCWVSLLSPLPSQDVLCHSHKIFYHQSLTLFRVQRYESTYVPTYVFNHCMVIISIVDLDHEYHVVSLMFLSQGAIRRRHPVSMWHNPLWLAISIYIFRDRDSQFTTQTFAIFAFSLRLQLWVALTVKSCLSLLFIEKSFCYNSHDFCFAWLFKPQAL